MEDLLVLRDWKNLDEVPELLDVWRNSVEGGRDFLSAADIDAVAVALETVYTQQVRVRIAELDSQIVGFCAFDSDRIQLLWVSHRERKNGVGSALLKDMLSITPGLCVQINGQQQQTIDFFTDHGFVPEPVKESPGALGRIDLRHTQHSVQDVAR